ncbi:winged helix-turn-helix transcriptional regulator [Paenibacillus elgii]
MAAISPNSLTDTLRRLEENGLLERTACPTVSFTIKYTLTPRARICTEY